MILYLDTSALLKALIEEDESIAFGGAVNAWLAEGHALVASWLLHTEAHCAARRHGGIDPGTVDAALEEVELIDLDRSHLLAAASMRHRLRTADALHLATASDLDADAFVTYDRELQQAAAREGMHVLHPGAGESRAVRGGAEHPDR